MSKEFIFPFNFNSRIVLKRALPKKAPRASQSILLYDAVLPAYVKGFTQWKRQFAIAQALNAGEGLKTVGNLDKVLKILLAKTTSIHRRESRIYVMGGGSVGDFGGFLASVFKRGIPLVQIPTTWLAVLDSSHGGKTALNVGKQKNQIGTFYPAREVWVLRELLEKQPPQRAEEALSELLKVSLLTRRPWAKQFHNDLTLGRRSAAALLRKYLHEGVHEKYRIVLKDPYEERGLRVKLNLGHTLAHCLELNARIHHGAAVAWGLKFMLFVSFREKCLTQKAYKNLWGLADQLPSFSLRKVKSLNLKSSDFEGDKKSEKNAIRFVCLCRGGHTEIRRVSAVKLHRYWKEFQQLI